MSPASHRHFYLTLICLLVLTLGAGPGAAEDPKPGPWTVDGEEKRVANVWPTTLADGKSQQLTRGTDRVSGIALAPDGRHLAFLSTRDLPSDGPKKKDDDKDAKPQLWAIPLHGGEPFPLTRFDRPVRDFAWIDSETLVVVAQESPAALEKERKKDKDTTVVVDDAEHEPPVRLFRASLDGKTERLGTDRDWIDSLAVSPDGTRAVVTAQQSLHYEFDQKTPPQTFLVDLTTGTRTRILADGDLLPAAIGWSPDGSGFCYTRAWFDQYLFATREDRNHAVRKGSLLEALLQRSAAARSGRALGEDPDGVLVPETVAYQGLRVGRFELTRAQFAAFDLVPGEENLPLTGVAFERPRAYVEWLAAATGEGYRLPTVAEAERLAKAAGSGGNTLDRWAGYTPNPDDAERIATALAGGNLASEAPLILPVGQLPGSGSDPVYDLDGKAAEWAVGEDGRGVTVGPSAERSTDPRSRTPAAAAYTGLRVVVDGR